MMSDIEPELPVEKDAKTPLRDLCALKNRRAIRCCLDFFGNLGIGI
jgi:hypothetical protein